jgi:O-antigen ligase
VTPTSTFVSAPVAVGASEPTGPAEPTVPTEPYGRDVLSLGLVIATVATLLLIPDRYTVPIDTRFGLRPHQIVLLVTAVVVVVRWRRGRRVSIGRPARVAGLLVVAAVASIAANVGHLDEAAYLAALRLTITLVFTVVAAMLVAVVATSARRRRLLLGVVVTLVAFSAILAAHESTTQQPVRLRPTPPGLIEEQDPSLPPDDTPSTIVRNGVARPAGLAANPLELSAVMALTAPFALYLALAARFRLARAWFTGCSLFVALGVVLSISRTGLLASALMIVIALAAHVRRPRMLLVGLLAIGVLGFTVTRLVPHSVDALVEQVGKDGNEDPSLATRLQDYDELDNLLGARPWLGRGPDAVSSYVSRDGTRMILDNQYLLAIAETGVIGLLALLALMASMLAAARRRFPAAHERGLVVAIVCATAGFALMCATFDVLRFSQATGVYMVAVGIASSSLVGRSSLGGADGP